MEKDILSVMGQQEMLLSNEYYFKFIFKKTEKIVCAVFYILSTLRNNEQNNVLLNSVEECALTTLRLAGATLSSREDQAPQAVFPLVERLVVLESELRVLSAAGLLGSAQLDTLVSEIDATLRTARSFKASGSQQTVRTGITRRRPASPVSRVPRKNDTEDASPQGERKDQIAAVLRAQPGASIKDITDTIKDYSDKTIQRDLNNMIDQGVVIREGEKRWSRYSLI